MDQPEEQRGCPDTEASDAQSEAQRAADQLTGQIAAVRKRIQDAKDALRRQASREPKSFKR